MTNDLPSVGTEDARRVSEANLADLMALHKLTSEGVWAQGQTSHHTIAKREGRDDYRIAEFHHAADASFVDVAHKYMPLLIGEVTDLRRERDELASRVAELEAEVLDQCRLNGMGAERESALMGRVRELESAALAAQPGSVGEQIMQLAHRWAQATYCKALGQPFEDFDAIQKEMRSLLAAATTEAKPAQQDAVDADDPLQGAVDWLLQADGEFFCVATVQRTLRIGYNRANRLSEVAKERAAISAKKGQP